MDRVPKLRSGERLSPSVRYALNGRFLTRKMTGVDRYAYELIREIARSESADKFCLVVPQSVEVPSDFAGITAVVIGKHSGVMWEQVDFARFAKKRELVPVGLCNTAPIFNPGFVCIHDMQVRVNPGFFNWKFVAWYRLLFASISRNAEAILTDTEFSKREIEKYYPTAKGNTCVVLAAWQHMERIHVDESAQLRHPALRKGSYYFAMSSLAPNKNLKWLVETARLNPKETIAIAGGINDKVFGRHNIPEVDNVVYLGYVSDSEAKALMQNCKGFLFPTFYEGFGIPPMEALACGAPVAVSDASCMREVYGASVRYIDPFSPCSNLDELFFDVVACPETTLKKYSWSQSAKKLVDLLESNNDMLEKRGSEACIEA